MTAGTSEEDEDVGDTEVGSLHPLDLALGCALWRESERWENINSYITEWFRAKSVIDCVTSAWSKK